MHERFIPNELAVAPNPLGMALNLRLVTVPIDAYTCFELWMPTSEGVLPEEAMLLMGDRSRLEELCDRIIWLMGARFLDLNSPDFQETFYSWEKVKHVLRSMGLHFNALGVTYLPQVIYPTLTDENLLTAWTIQPATWKVSFFYLQPEQSGYMVKALSASLLLSFGQPLTRLMQKVPVASHAV